MKTLSCQKRDSSLGSRRLTTVGLFFVGLMASLAIGISTAGAQTYIVKDLGIVPGMNDVVATHLNNYGDVVGISSAGDEKVAARYKASQNGMEAIGGPGSRAFAINDIGLAVGDSIFQDGSPVSRAAFFKGGQTYDLGTLKGALFSRANDINAANQIVGFAGRTLDSPYSRAFVWTGRTGMRDIGTLGGPFAQANAINDRGFVTGTAELPRKHGETIGTTHAFLYSTGPSVLPMQDLGTLGGASSYGTCINVSNHVVGYSDINMIDSRVHAFLFNGGKLIDLGSLNTKLRQADNSVALGINSSDQVVGYAFIPAQPSPHPVQVKQVAFIWSRDSNVPNGMKDLNQLIGGASRMYYLFSASAIDDKGRIAATAYIGSDLNPHAVLLTPDKPADH